jgi:hypothetical protein
MAEKCVYKYCTPYYGCRAFVVGFASFCGVLRGKGALNKLAPPISLWRPRGMYRRLPPSFCRRFSSHVSSHKEGSGHVVAEGSIGRFLLCIVLFVPAFAGAQQNSSETARRVTNRVVPAYPELARAMNVRGIVRLDVLVAPNGTKDRQSDWRTPCARAGSRASSAKMEMGTRRAREQ